MTRRLLVLVRLIITLLGLRQVDVLFVVKDASRPYLYQGRRYSPVFDTLRDRFEASGATCLTITPPKSVLSGDEAHGSPIALGPFVRLLGRPSLERLLLPPELRRQARRLTAGQRRLVVTWYQILRRIRPAMVFAVYPIGALVTTCRWLGIDVVDVQHGVFHAGLDEGANYYGLNNPDETARPTVYWTWDERSATEVGPRAAQIGAHVVLGGNPWQERFARPDPSDCLVKDAAERLERRLGALPRPFVLAALSYSPRGPGAIGERLFLGGSEVPLGLARAMSASPHATWLLRLHPVSLAGSAPERERAIAAELVLDRTTLDVSDVPLPLLLPAIDACVSVGSSVLFEAAQVGVPIAFLRLDNDPPVLDYGFTPGDVDVIDSTQEAILSWIERLPARAVREQDQLPGAAAPSEPPPASSTASDLPDIG